MALQLAQHQNVHIFLEGALSSFVLSLRRFHKILLFCEFYFQDCCLSDFKDKVGFEPRCNCLPTQNGECNSSLINHKTYHNPVAEIS